MSLREKTRTKKPLKVVNFSVASKDDKEIKYTIIILHTRKRVIFHRILSKEILLSSLEKSELPLMITAMNKQYQDIFFKAVKGKGTDERTG